MTAAQALVLLLALVGANLPFFSRRILFVLPPRAGEKGLAWRLLEVLLAYFIVGGIAALMESRAHGGVYPQHWEFYATTLCLFIVLAYPGFVIRYLWPRHKG
ncbi:MAG TPA: DUF2818 family protein [Rhodocyclaceae bacterium]